MLSACSSGGGEEGNGGGGGGGGGGGWSSGSGIPSGPGPGGYGTPEPAPNPLSIPLEFTVRNEHAAARTETILASVPFPAGGYPDLAGLTVAGRSTAWRVLQRWPDNTVRIGQAQFTDTLPAGTLRSYTVDHSAPALTGSFQRHPWVQQAGGAFEVGAQVRDTFQVPYRGFAAGPAVVLVETPLMVVKRWRVFHQAASGGIGRDYLTSVFYVTEFRDVPIFMIDWIVGNDYRGQDVIPPGNVDPELRPLGMIDVAEARLLVRGATAVSAYRPSENAIAPPETQPDGYTGFQVIQNSYLEDGQTRRYRFLARFVPPGAPQHEQDAVAATMTGMLQRPIYALATQPTWQATRAAGLLGGPIAGPVDAAQRAEAEYGSWAGGTHFGTWGTHGDVLKTGTTGTPRNHPLSPELAHAIQGNHHRLLQKLEAMAWVQALRPYHLYGLLVGPVTDLLLWDGIPLFPGSRDLSRESLGRRALWANDPYAAYRTMTQRGDQRAHGWNPYDIEHWSTDLLFDYWTITGDAWAKEELRQLEQSLKATMKLTNSLTAHVQTVRAEGWCMQGFVQCYQASGDPGTKEFAIRRAREIVDVEREKNHPSKSMMMQGNYAGTTWPMPHEFYMPWQHGAVLYGYLAAARFLEDPIFLEISEDVVDCVAYGWVTEFTDPLFGTFPNGLRYYVPTSYEGAPCAADVFDSTHSGRFGDSPLGGAHNFLIGGLHILADATRDANVRNRALLYGSWLRGHVEDRDRAYKWNYCLPAWHVR